MGTIETIKAATEKFRIRLAFKLIGRLPVVANVEVGGPEGYAVTAKGHLWANKHVTFRASSHLVACLLVRS